MDTISAFDGGAADDAARSQEAILPVILAGGSGVRLWPLSRESRPKPFLKLTGEATMLQETILRLSAIDCAAPLIVCNEEHRFLAAEQLRAIGRQDARILLEPVARSTAPALAMAALIATAGGDDPVMLALAADHVIADAARFGEALASALVAARAGKLVTFGVVPSRPETEYGYIETGAEAGGAMAVAGFTEKPDMKTAERYVADGRHLWNSGIFVFRASRYLDELATHRPDIHAQCIAAAKALETDMHFIRVDGAAFERCPSQSIDRAVMERTGNAVVVPLDAGWTDIGSWSALWDAGEKDAYGNLLQGDVMAVDTARSLVRADHRLVVTLGVEDLVIVETGDAVFVADKRSIENVRDIVDRLRGEGRQEAFSQPARARGD